MRESSFRNFLFDGSSSDGPSLPCLMFIFIPGGICGGIGVTNPAIGGGAATKNQYLVKRILFFDILLINGGGLIGGIGGAGIIIIGGCGANIGGCGCTCKRVACGGICGIGGFRG